MLSSSQQLGRHGQRANALGSKASSGAAHFRPIPQQQQVVPTIPRPTTPDVYEAALHYARRNQVRAARVVFERLLKDHPTMCKAWVSYAQMEKRYAEPQERWERCRSVLQRGLQLNPSSACLVQAWGLMELQRGNWVAALMLLERSVRMDPRLRPVLNWTQVDMARKTVGSRRSRHLGVLSGGGGADDPCC